MACCVAVQVIKHTMMAKPHPKRQALRSHVALSPIHHMSPGHHSGCLQGLAGGVWNSVRKSENGDQRSIIISAFANTGRGFVGVLSLIESKMNKKCENILYFSKNLFRKLINLQVPYPFLNPFSFELFQ